MEAKTKIDVFAFTSYKSLLKDLLTGSDNRGKLAAASNFIECQRSYLGRVIKEKVHLSSDMSFKLTTFFKFSSDERDYFLLLVEYARSGSKDYQQLLLGKMRTLKLENDALAVRANRSRFVIDSKDVNYFSSWIPNAIHLLTSVPKMQTTSALAKHLNLHEDQILYFLNHLKANDFVSSDGRFWKYKGGEIHLNKDSPLVHFHHQNWRSRAVVNAQTQSDSIHSTFVYTMSLEDYEKIKSLILKLISDLSRISGPSEPQECVAFTCDFFKV